MVELATLPNKGPPKLHLLALPNETIEAIFSQVDPEDLINLCLVSRSIREHAASRLYRSLHCVLQPRCDAERKWPIDRLAKELETLTTSDFNYAAYIRSICLDTAPLNHDNDNQFHEQIVEQFKYDTPCGKFFNNLLLASIKKISSLESFRWNLRLELSPTIFMALGKISTLQQFSIRMPAGVDPLLEKPTPIPPPPGPPVTGVHLITHHNHMHPHPPPPPLATTHYLPHNLSRGRDKLKSRKYWDPRHSFSHLSQLSTLEVLEMDNLGYIDEITKCISQSSSTLKNLKLSFSERLALASRKKKEDEVSETSSVQDEDELYQPLPPPPPQGQQPAAFTSSSSKNSEVRRERLAQEQVLSRLFGANRNGTDQMVENALADASKALQAKDDAHVAFNEYLNSVLEKLRTEEPKYQAVITEIEKIIYPSQGAAADRNADTNLQTVEEAGVPPTTAPGGSNADDAAPAGESQSGLGANAEEGEDPKPDDAPGLVEQKDAASIDLEKRLDSIVDLDHPDHASEGEDQEFINEHDHDHDPVSSKNLTNGSVLSINSGNTSEPKGKEPMEMIPVNEAEVVQIDCEVIQDYVRENHGIALEKLSICLVPVKATILCQSINVWTLRHISLLNVGPQRAFWATLENLNKLNPLPLVSVHTDNVTSYLLSFLNAVPRLEELFLFERSTNSRVEPSTPKTTVTIEDIRKQVLRKHMGTLKRLMIRNDNDLSWTFNLSSVALLAKYGQKLVELVAHFDGLAFHSLMRTIRNMESLYVLHVLLSDPDYCLSVLDEIRECAIDNFLHCNFIKERYIAVSYASGPPIQTRCTLVERCGRKIKDSPKLHSNTAETYDEFEYLGMFNGVSLTDIIQFEDEPGVQVWKKEIWNLML